MRLSAYKKAMDQASQLPDTIPELLSYFNYKYSPMNAALEDILDRARSDKAGLFHDEFVDLYEYYKKLREAK